MNIKGNLYIISAASGTGKTSLAKAVARTVKRIKISISHTARPIRRGERQDVNYFFVDKKTFENMIAANEFLEYAEVFGYYYGTSKSFILKELEAGIDVILDIDWQGAKQVKQKMPNCITIFLLPPSKIALKQRLQKRRRDPAEVIENRLQMASDEIAHCDEFDYIIINDRFSQALRSLQAIIYANRLKKDLQMLRYETLLKDLL